MHGEIASPVKSISLPRYFPIQSHRFYRRERDDRYWPYEHGFDAYGQFQELLLRG